MAGDLDRGGRVSALFPGLAPPQEVARELPPPPPIRDVDPPHDSGWYEAYRAARAPRMVAALRQAHLDREAVGHVYTVGQALVHLRCELREPGGLVHEVVSLMPPRTWDDLRGLARRLAHRWGWTGRAGVVRALALMVGA